MVQTLTELARTAQVDLTATPEMFLTGTAETSVLDRRRAIEVRVAALAEPLPAAASSWPDNLLNPNTTVITIDGSHATRMLRELKGLAITAAQTPYRDHVRILPITAELAHQSLVHRWAGLPDRISSGGLPVFCLSIAARLVSLTETDLTFREAKVHCNELGTVCIQSVGATVTAMEVRHPSRPDATCDSR